MKYSFLFLAIALISCNSFNAQKNSDASTEIRNGETQNSPERINATAPYEGSVMLLGKANRKGLEKDDFKVWFAPGYKEYAPKPEFISKLKPLIKNVDITLFMGTWCEDSHRDVPHLYKILDELNYDESKLTVYAVSEDKTTPEGHENGLDIQQVPTIIFYKNGNELGRIVEYSIKTVEEDMYAILNGDKYKNPYSE